MCIDFDGHHSGGSSFVYAYDILILLYIYIYIYKQVKSPSIWSRTLDLVRICHSGRTGNRGLTIQVA